MIDRFHLAHDSLIRALNQDNGTVMAARHIRAAAGELQLAADQEVLERIEVQPMPPLRELKSV